MDIQTGLICVGFVGVAAVVILVISMFSIKGQTYEEAIAEQRKLPNDLLLGKREKGKEKKHKNKTGKKVKEKKEEKEEKEEEKNEHVQFEETPQILTSEALIQDEKNVKGNKKKGKIDRVKPILINKDDPIILAPELNPSQPQAEDVNHFNLIQPKDDLELVRTHSRENLQHLTQSEPIVNKSPKDTPTKSKKNVKEQPKKIAEVKEEKKEIVAAANPPQPITVKEIPKEIKEPQKETPVKEAKDIAKDVAAPVQTGNKESKNKKKRHDILAQIGGDKDGVNISLLMPLVQKAELSRSEIQILIDQLLNKQLDNPLEHSEWTEGRADPVIKLKKQLAEKEKALADEQEASIAFQNKLKELRSELNAEKSRLLASNRQLEEGLNAKVTETQTLHTRMQHILESHAAEKQGFTRQIEQLQSKVNDDVTTIHNMQEDQGHKQQEIIAQRKQHEVQLSQLRENESALKAQLAQKHAEIQILHENSATDVDRLRQQLAIVGEQFLQSEAQLQHYKDAGEMVPDMTRQLEESHRALGDLEHRLQNARRHEQDLQIQLNSVKSELNVAKNEASEVSNLKSELNKVQGELNKLKSELSVSQNEAKTEAVEITSLKTELIATQNDLKQSHSNLINVQAELKNSQSNSAKVQKDLDIAQGNLKQSAGDLLKAQDEVKNGKTELTKAQNELSKIQNELSTTQEELKNAYKTISELKSLTVEVERLQQSARNSSDSQIEVTRLQEENNRLSSQSGTVIELQKEIRKLREENESLASQLAATTERPAAEGRENGVEKKAVKNNVQLIEHDNLLAQKESLLDELRAEVTQKDTELSKLTVQLEALQSDINNERQEITGLRNDLEVQKTKNNELRTKNWKVMEALTAAESRSNSIPAKAIDELSQKVRIEEQKSTEALLQRIFPDISISELSHEKWLSTFEQKVSTVITDLRRNKDNSNADQTLEKQNKSLQGMVSHYKQIIDDTEGILNRLQNHIESEELRWQAQIQQKDEILAGLKVELDDLRTKSGDSEKLKQKISELETRLGEAEALGQQTQVLQVKHEPSLVKGDKNQSFAVFEQLGEDKARLLEALRQESGNKTTLDAEVARLRSLLEISESSLAEEKNLVSQLHQEVFQLKNEVYAGGCSSSDQSTVNGPPLSDSSKSESSAVAQSLLAALEKTLKNTELAKCPVTETTDLVDCREENDSSFLISKNSPQTCQMIDHNTQASWNPLNGQQHKKHKKKRKGGSGKK